MSMYDSVYYVDMLEKLSNGKVEKRKATVDIHNQISNQYKNDIDNLREKLQAAEEENKVLREAVEFGLRYYSNSEVGDKCKQALEKVKKP